jgi:hypothetical protein
MHFHIVIQFGKAILGSSEFVSLFVETVPIYHMNIHIDAVESTIVTAGNI